MKYLILLITILTFVFTATLFSQQAFKKGNYSLTGSVSYSSSDNESNDFDSESITILVSPGLSYLIADNLALGIEFGFGYFETQYESKFGGKHTSIDRPYMLGPSLRYYFPQVSINPFIEASVFYADDVVDNAVAKGFSVTGGLNLFLSNSVAIEPFIEYSKTSFNRAEQDITEIMFGARINYFIIN